MFSTKRHFEIFSTFTLILFLFAGLGHSMPFKNTQKAKPTSVKRRNILKRAVATVAVGAGLLHSKGLSALSRVAKDNGATKSKQALSDSNKRVLKIATTAPSGTELVEALGESAQLVGVDDYSDYPKKVAALPKTGDVVAPNVDAIASLRPDLVVLDSNQVSTQKALKDLGIKTFTAKFATTRDVQTSLTALGALLGLEARAKRVNREIAHVLHQTPAEKGKRVLVVLERNSNGNGNITAAGPGSHVDELLAKAGLQNVLAHQKNAFASLSLDDLDPKETDLILDLSQGGRSNLAEWKQNPRFRNVKVRALTSGAILAPTPRVQEGIDQLKDLSI